MVGTVWMAFIRATMVLDTSTRGRVLLHDVVRAAYLRGVQSCQFGEFSDFRSSKSQLTMSVLSAQVS